MTQACRALLVFSLVLLIGIAPFVYASVRSTSERNLRIVEPGFLYRSGKLTLPVLTRVIEEYNIRTVISFRPTISPRDKTPEYSEIAEEEKCRELGINYYRLEPKVWDKEDDESTPAPVQVNVDQLLAILDDPKNRPVLVHCFAGVHRTGAYCAIARMEYHGWSNEEALKELEQLGYKNLGKEDDVRGYLSTYVPRQDRKKSD